jgi:hypothetical protein
MPIGRYGTGIILTYIHKLVVRRQAPPKKNSSFSEDHSDHLRENEMLKQLIDIKMYMSL